ncbi:hypothetical protein [Pedobacter sp. UBA5917]|jgi:hypothetical protein|uniref:hypothetical protein n=1 Tax=Pedobacter sp. UBA5917 TaxID=1947061 RepID=UPI0025F33019|nr:hypothetical protein [Pedobacter sp. UBA5917]
MNDIFNISRFIGLLKKHSSENYKTYLMSTGVLVGILTLILSFLAYMSDGHIGVFQQGIIFLNVMLFSGTIFCSMIFADLGSRKKAIPILTLPVSHIEKYLVAWLYSFVIFQLVYVGCFYAVDYIVVHTANNGILDKNSMVNVFSLDDKFWIVFPQFAVLHAICFIGAIFFERLHFIKTAFLFFVFILLISLLNPVLLHWIFGITIDKGVPFGAVGITEHGNFWMIRRNTVGDYILLVSLILVCVSLWAGTYFKLKEKQV